MCGKYIVRTKTKRIANITRRRNLSMQLSHFLNGIYSIEENPMDATNSTFQKAETKRKKQVQNVPTEELQTHKGKDIQKSTQIHKNVTFKKIYISQLNLINKLSLMRMLLLLVRVRNTLFKKISMRALSFLINKLFI